jgi:hypothetical protein
MGSFERGQERPPDPKPDEPNPPAPPHPDPPAPTAGVKFSCAPGAAAMVFPATAALLLRLPAERAALTGRAGRLRG